MAQTTDIRYLRYLPAIYQEAPSILREYLAPFEDWFEHLRDLLARIDTYLTPSMAPASEFLPWLGAWVALALDEEWDEDRRRRLISQAVELYRWRGTASGLRRYLELYTGLRAECIEIHEGRWPSGMQIGVTSRIGSFAGGPAPARVERVRRIEPAVVHDYYVVVTAGAVRYIPVASVDAVDYEGGMVLLRRAGAPPEAYPRAALTRRNSLPATKYEVTLPAGDGAAGGGGVVEYHGDGCCITEAPRPYSFIVRLLASPAEYDMYATPRKLSKLKAIVELEKPAHTVCYLDLQRRRRTPHRLPMQIGVTSTIGLGAIVPVSGDKEQL